MSFKENIFHQLKFLKFSIHRAHLRLGIHYLSHEDPRRAILSLQSVLRSEPSNIDAWECLADAYFARGSYNSALKAYEHVSFCPGLLSNKQASRQ